MIHINTHFSGSEMEATPTNQPKTQRSTAETQGLEQRSPAPSGQKTLGAIMAEFDNPWFLGSCPVAVPYSPAKGNAVHEYYSLLKKCHNAVVKEYDINLASYKANPSLKNSPEGMIVTAAIYTKFAENQRGRELMEILDLNETTSLGEPRIPYDMDSFGPHLIAEDDFQEQFNQLVSERYGQYLDENFMLR